MTDDWSFASQFLIMSEKWPLSQLANKSNGTCSFCLATRQLHLRNGTIHKHGPRDDPCPRSHKPPLQASTAPPPSAFTGDTGASPVQSSLPSAVWSPSESTLIKHIPKSARASYPSHLASLLGKVVANPNSAANWLELFNWGNTVLHPPKRGGRRHKLGKTIKDRISAYGAGHSDNDFASFSVCSPA